ncbi:MAG TPA: hypothetical protein PKE00_05400 [Planctomycetota bacterium]|nr:hypothetical protein [Planctomycetota bacterium]
MARLSRVFVLESDGFVRFHETRPPSDAAVTRLNECIARAVRRILLADAHRDDAEDEYDGHAFRRRNARSGLSLRTS